MGEGEGEKEDGLTLHGGKIDGEGGYFPAASRPIFLTFGLRH
jgi:hypothetical protein